jgi:NAD(P)-dependent dehydrogenase (short-subunit alcohol dehydrogenase family)
MSDRAFVTGASRGIGKAIAVALAEHGFDVAIAARTLRAGEATREHSQTVHKVDTRPLPGSVEETAAEIEALGQRALPIVMDLTDLATVEVGTSKVLDEWGGIDVLVHNGRHIGPGIMDTIADTPIEQYPLFVMAHGVAPIRITQMVLPGMLARGRGTVVMISSGAGYDFYPENPKPGLAYRIGKAAGHTLVGSVLAEYGDQGIRAFNVDPGFVLTERNSLDADDFGFDTRFAAPPSAIGAAVAWVATSADADELQRSDIQAQPLVLERELHPDWRPVAPAS